MKLAIVGTKNLEDPWHLPAMWIIGGALINLEPELIISGGAKGIDSLAEFWAIVNHIPFKKFLPENPHWEPNGYKDRNIKIAEACDELLMIGLHVPKTHGSVWTANYAEMLGKRVYRVYV